MPPPTETGTRLALVVSDPATRLPGLGRLPNAAREGDAVETRLRELGWNVTRLGGEAAAHSDVVDALARADWLHYAGHGIAAGHTGWESGLPLAGEAMLDVSAILSVPRIPSVVVLSACDTSGTTNTRNASMQIASAFLLGGAEFVIAAQGEVSDEAALRFSSQLYALAGQDLAGPELASRAVASLVATGEPMSTWAGFHVWAP